MSTVLQTFCKPQILTAGENLCIPQFPWDAGLAQLVEHLICNQVFFEQNQSPACKLFPDFVLKYAAIGVVLQTFWQVIRNGRN